MLCSPLALSLLLPTSFILGLKKKRENCCYVFGFRHLKTSSCCALVLCSDLAWSGSCQTCSLGNLQRSGSSLDHSECVNIGYCSEGHFLGVESLRLSPCSQSVPYLPPLQMKNFSLGLKKVYGGRWVDEKAWSLSTK